MATSYLGQLTTRRKVALGFALLWLIAFVTLVLPVALHSAPASWQVIYLLPVVAFNALAIGVGLFELTCWIDPGVARLVEGKYCLSVQVLFGVFPGAPNCRISNSAEWQSIDSIQAFGTRRRMPEISKVVQFVYEVEEKAVTSLTNQISVCPNGQTRGAPSRVAR